MVSIDKSALAFGGKKTSQIPTTLAIEPMKPINAMIGWSVNALIRLNLPALLLFNLGFANQAS